MTKGVLAWLGLTMMAVAAAAQTTVTTSGGATNTVPVFTGSAAVGNSPITVSGSNVGIGTTNPVTALSLADVFDPNPNTGSQRYYANGGLTFTSSHGYTIGQIAPVQESGQYVDRGDMAFLVGQGSGTTIEAMRVLGINGSVGIGTTNPQAKLEINGNLRFTADGTVQTTAWTGTLCGGDYAESVDVTGDRKKYEPGDVLVIDPNTPGKFLKSADPYSSSVSGIYSTKPGTVGRRQVTAKSPDEVPMAVVGIVPAKVSAENGAIRPGDLLVSSSKIGYAMKGTDRSQMLGAVIGKALGSLDSGTGVIEVLVTLQ